MALNCKKCRVCGKEYKACNPIGLKSDKFRWQTVACSPECGAIYLERFIAARLETPRQVVNLEPETPDVVDLYTPPFDDEDIEDEFEDEEEDE